MRISVEEVLDYIHCPMFYRFKYKSVQNGTPYLNLYEKYEKDIHKFMYAYHSQLQNGDAVDGSTVKRIWGSLWIGEKNKQDLIFVETGDKRDTWNEKRKQGIENLMTYHSRGKKNVGIPILVNHEFEVEISKDIILTGNFELIQETNQQTELVNFKADSKKMTQALLRKDIETTAFSFAFREIFGQPEDKLVVYYVDKNRGNQTVRTKEDYEIFKESVRNISVAIRNDLFYIAPNTSCISCVYKNKCDNFLTLRNMI